MLNYFKTRFLTRFSKYPFSNFNSKKHKFFISEQELTSLISQKTKVRIGIMAVPIIKEYHEGLINSDDDNYTFYYKMTDPSQTEMQIVHDPELKALAINRLKQSLDKTLHVPLRYYSWIYGPQNFVDFSEKPDKQRILEYMDLFEIEPIYSTLREEDVKRKFKEIDGIVLPGGLDYPYEPMDSEEFIQYYEPNGKPKTELKHRVDSEIFKVYKTWINEIISINSTGQFLPSWHVCLS
jgi:hypothetical protein